MFDGQQPQPPKPAPPSREQILEAQRNALSARVLDFEVENAMLQSELSLARARIAELEAPAQETATARTLENPHALSGYRP